MSRETLIDFFDDFAQSDDVFVVHDDGYRARSVTYRQVALSAQAFAAHLAHAGIARGDNLVIWSENSIEWIVALWGALLAGVVVVPVDYRVSAEYLQRISAIVAAKAILVGEEVARPEATSIPVWRMREVVVTTSSNGTAPEAAPPRNPGGLAEILFTSGATAEPKGVTITHSNVLANIVPIEREVRRYRTYARPFHPIRFLNLLPLSHLFGQSMATFIPPMLRGTVIFTHGYNPAEILRQIKTRRVSVLICVPKVLGVLADHVKRVSPRANDPALPPGTHWLKRWWHYREVHRLFGWKFWCVICGAAPLDPALELFWRQLGFLVIQGYGLTETAPIVTLNHPFRASSGTVGRPLEGVEVKIADDGEILVRGANVTSGYYRAPGQTSGAAADSTVTFDDGWFHTGDIGGMDATGRLVIKGRKKEMIATPQGLKVFPEDVERVLEAEPGVREAAVVGVRVSGEERVHAVLVITPGTDVAAVIRAANARLEDHQRVWSSSMWPAAELPRTEGTRKLKRREIQRWASGEAPVVSTSAAGVTVESVVLRFAAARDINRHTTLDELGLSSLDRVELMMALEEAFHVTLDEPTFAAAKTIGDLARLTENENDAGSSFSALKNGEIARDSGDFSPSKTTPGVVFPSWNRSRFWHFVRRISLPTWILPLARVFMRLRVDGLDHLRDLRGPVIFASNHQSHMDTPAILVALPRRWRYRIAPAMAKEFFRAHFNRAEFGWRAWFTNSLNYYLACQFFNAFPLPQREAGTRQTLRYIGELGSDGYSMLIFPEGLRTAHGAIGQFRPGVGMMASKLDLPVVPVRIDGLDRVLDPKMKWPKRGPVRIAFGAPLRLSGDDYAALAKQVEDAVRAL